MIAILARQKQKNLLKISLSCRGIRAMLFRQEQKLIQTETHLLCAMHKLKELAEFNRLLLRTNHEVTHS